MVALPNPPPDPYGVIDTAPMEETLASVTTIYAESLPETVAVAPAAAVILAGAVVTTKLLENQKWDNFWIHVGGKLNDVWHAAGNFLFGGHGAPSLDTVQQLIQLSMHVSLRATRQLVTSLAAKTVAVEGALYRGLFSVAHTLDRINVGLTGRINAVQAYAVARALQVEQYARSVATNAAVSAYHLARQADAQLRAEIARDLVHPLQSKIDTLEREVKSDAARVAGVTHVLNTSVLPGLASATAAALAAKAIAAKLQQWEDDCGEPMCETVGPKTNWGKLFKTFDSALLWALLVELAAMDPHALETAAVDVANVIGTPLADWAESWLGLATGNRTADEGAVSREVGKLPGLP